MSIDELNKKMMESHLFGYDQFALIPLSSGVYSAWLKASQQCLYIGIAGNSPKGNLRERIRSHFSGQRGGDQFCLYCYDVFVHDLRSKILLPMKTCDVNRTTADWIRSHVKFRLIELEMQEARYAEKVLRHYYKPILNPI